MADNVNKKILTIEELAQRAVQLRSEGRRVVATNGCFDILHVGHVRYLAAARKLGDLLVVGVNGDDSVRQLKGEGRPVNREQDRAEVLAALESVDYVTIFPEKRATNFLGAAQPAV
jgi:D-glycero-beta-D-manno-heptose 1-phosphate adenylyltransferase